VDNVDRLFYNSWVFPRVPDNQMVGKNEKGKGTALYARQKPIEVLLYTIFLNLQAFEHLIALYTDTDDSVLDLSANVLVSAAAAWSMGRNWYGYIEEQKQWDRIKNAAAEFVKKPLFVFLVIFLAFYLILYRMTSTW
jgi:DNA modification methylase